MLFTSNGGQVAQPSFRRRRLAKKLLGQREDAGISVAEAVRLTGFSQSKLSRIETGVYGVSSDDVRTICEAYGSNAEVTETLAQLARAAKQRNLWWQSYSDLLGNVDYIELEADSAAVFIFTIDIIPGLLQTPEYTEAVIRADLPYASNDSVQRRIEARMARQQQVRDRSVKIWSIIDEPALLRPIGGHSVMADQIDHLIAASKSPQVSVQVLPITAGVHESLGKPFTMFVLRDGFHAVGLDSHNGGLFMEDKESVQNTKEAWTGLAARALPFPHSIELLRARSEDHRRSTREHEEPE
ncbi:helix-turn-helix domain-containing protein [Amycolatopsis sp. cg5]|uniref:helix-turn-helix domain-containing protein n=1 Tax=Amycolatopsis sp. cg5 TaxID=3238802 RepID=UPI0035231CDC